MNFSVIKILVQFMNVEAFDYLRQLTQNIDKIFEFVGGEAVEKVSSPYLSSIAGEICYFIKRHLKQNNIDGHVTGEAGGYKIGGERYAPDVAYMPATKQPQLDKDGYNSVPPDLAVEVVSSDSKAELDKLRIKITNYLYVGTTVWVIKPEDKRIEVHQSGQPVTIYRAQDTLDGGDVLPSFQMKLSDVFGETSNTDTAN